MELWQHQRRMLDFSNFGSAEDYTLLYAGMSSGKTLVGLEYARQFEGLKLVLAPAAALQVWNADYASFYANPDFELHVMNEGSSVQKFEKLQALQRRKANAIIVLSYETAARIPLNVLNFSAAIADEVQRLGSHNGVQSMKIAAELANVPHKVAMSGTIYHDGYERLYGITRFLDCYVPASKSAHPQSRIFNHWNDFLRDYCKTFLKGYTPIIIGYRNVEKLAAKIKPFTLVIKTEDVVALPPYTERVYKVPLSPKVRKVYDSIEADGVATVEGATLLAPHVLTRTIRLQQIASAGVLVGEDGSEVCFDMTPRLDVLSNILEDLDELPCVIFTKYTREVELITERLSKMGVSYNVLTGSLNQYEAWKDGESRVLVANLSAGSESVRLERAAHLIRWSVGYSLKEFVQANGRIRRYGQKSATVHYHSIVTEDTVDEQLYEVLRAKSLDVSELDELLKD